MKFKNQEEFNNAINFIPFWVKSEEDLRKYTSHLLYKLYQERDMRGFLERKACERLSNHEEIVLDRKLQEIKKQYDEWFSPKEVEFTQNCA